MKKIILHGDLKKNLGDRIDLFFINGAIATKEQFENFIPSVAHCFNDGLVRRFNAVIGKMSEIEFLQTPIELN